MTEHQRQTAPPHSGYEDWNGGSWGPNPPRPGSLPDLSPLFALLDAMRRAVPGELQEQFAALQREILLTIRALIDWYLERLDRPKQGPKVEDIPLD